MLFNNIGILSVSPTAYEQLIYSTTVLLLLLLFSSKANEGVTTIRIKGFTGTCQSQNSLSPYVLFSNPLKYSSKTAQFDKVTKKSLYMLAGGGKKNSFLFYVSGLQSYCFEEEKHAFKKYL